MKLKKRQYRELMDRLTIQTEVIDKYCLEHVVSEELAYIHKDIQSAIFYLGSAYDQLAALMKENEGKCQEQEKSPRHD